MLSEGAGAEDDAPAAPDGAMGGMRVVSSSARKPAGPSVCMAFPRPVPLCTKVTSPLLLPAWCCGRACERPWDHSAACTGAGAGAGDAAVGVEALEVEAAAAACCAASAAATAARPGAIGGGPVLEVKAAMLAHHK